MGDLRTALQTNNKCEAPSMPVRGAPVFERDRPVSGSLLIRRLSFAASGDPQRRVFTKRSPAGQVK
jgi:hypothetical protein